MKILVTGATGFIGSRLVPALLDEGHSVAVVGRRRNDLEAFGSDLSIDCDLRDPSATARFPRALDAVIHLAQANLSKPDEAELFALNALSTSRLLEYAERAGATSFVLASSGSVYGGSPHAQRESDPARGADPYARSKLEAERLVLERRDAIGSVILRLFAPYGPGQRNRLIPELISRIRSKRPVTLRRGGMPRLNPIYVDHVVEVLRQAVVPPGQPIVNVAGEVVLSVRDMAEAIGRVVATAPIFEEVAEDAQEDLIGDTTLLQRCFRLPSPLIGFEEGIATIVAAT